MARPQGYRSGEDERVSLRAQVHRLRSADVPDPDRHLDIAAIGGAQVHLLAARLEDDLPVPPDLEAPLLEAARGLAALVEEAEHPAVRMLPEPSRDRGAEDLPVPVGDLDLGASGGRVEKARVRHRVAALQPQVIPAYGTSRRQEGLEHQATHGYRRGGISAGWILAVDQAVAFVVDAVTADLVRPAL